MQGDDPVIAMLQITLTNRSAGEKTVILPLRVVEDERPAETLVERNGLVYDVNGRLRFLLETSGVGALVRQELRPGLRGHAACGAGAYSVCENPPHRPDRNEREKTPARAGLCAGQTERGRVLAETGLPRERRSARPTRPSNNFYRSHLMHMLVINDREPGSDCNVARCGGFWYGSFPDEGCMVIDDLDRRGYTAEAERCLDLYVQYQGTVPLPGNFKSR